MEVTEPSSSETAVILYPPLPPSIASTAVTRVLNAHAQGLGDAPTRLVGREEAQRREPDVKADAGIVELIPAAAAVNSLHGCHARLERNVASAFLEITL
jgi:hypothetical protein